MKVWTREIHSYSWSDNKAVSLFLVGLWVRKKKIPRQFIVLHQPSHWVEAVISWVRNRIHGGKWGVGSLILASTNFCGVSNSTVADFKLPR